MHILFWEEKNEKTTATGIESLKWLNAQENEYKCVFVSMKSRLIDPTVYCIYSNGFLFIPFYLQVWCGTFSTTTSYATRIGRFRRWECASRWWATHIVTRHTGNINRWLESGIFHFYCSIKLNLNLLKMLKANGGGGDDDDNGGFSHKRKSTLAFSLHFAQIGRQISFNIFS